MFGVVARAGLDDGPLTAEENANSGGGRLGSKSAKGEKRQITRNRTSYSCQACRRRKIKCDKIHPKCGACQKADEECVYGKSDIPQTEEQSTSGSFLGIGGHGEKRRAVFEEQGRTSPPLHAPIGTSSNKPGLDTLELQLRRLTSMIESLKRDSPPSSAANAPLTPPTSESNADTEEASRHGSHPPATIYHTSTTDVDSVTRPIAELYLNSKRSQQSKEAKEEFWASISEELHQMQSLVQNAMPLGNTAPVIRLSQCPNGESRPPSPEPVEELPRKTNRFGFHSRLHPSEDDSHHASCDTCSLLSSEKATLLMGPSSARLDAKMKLDLSKGIPTEAQSNVLLRSWLTGVYPVISFTPLRTVFLKYHSFWVWKQKYDEDPVQVNESPDIYFMVMLNIIWYAGALSLSKRGIQHWFSGSTRAQICAHYHDQAVRYLRLVSFPSNNKSNLLGCFLMLQSLPCAEEEPLESSAYINLMVRLAQNLGLHRAVTYEVGDRYEAEMRCRKWWQILQLDLSCSVTCGYPPIVHDDLTDTPPISTLQEIIIVGNSQTGSDMDDENSKESTISEPLSSKPSKQSVFQIVAKARAIIGQAMRKVSHMHLKTETMTKDDLFDMNRIVNDAEAIVQGVVKSIPTKGLPELGFTPFDTGSRSLSWLDKEECLSRPLEQGEIASYIGDDRTSMAPELARYHRHRLMAYYKWARITLSMMCDQMHCVAYSPFLKNARSKLWTAARQCALHHCTSFLRKFISLATDASLEPYRWSWPSLHQPMHAAIIALVDTYERPNSIEAPRTRALIDQMFALSDPIIGIVGGDYGPSTQRPLHEGGSEAWDLLRGLRSAAWRKAKLDPDVLWAEADQIRVGVAKPLTREQMIAQHLREDSLYDEGGNSPSESPAGAGTDETFVGMQFILRMTKGTPYQEHDTKSLSAQDSLSHLRDDPQCTMQTSSEGLRRLPDQQPMPYPLNRPPTPRYPNNIAQINGKIDDPAAAEEIIRTDDRLKKVQLENRLHDASKQVGSITISPLENMTNNNNTPPLDSTSHDTACATALAASEGTFGKILNSMASAYASNSKASFLPWQHKVSSSSSSGVNIDSDEMLGLNGVQKDTEGFDWERWDAVFGQYSGYTDFMEDITWEVPEVG